MTAGEEWQYWEIKRKYGSDAAYQYFIQVTKHNHYKPVPDDYEPPF